MLDAARELFIEQGYAVTTVADIIWSMNGPEYWTLLVSDRGWSPGQFGNHLTDAWQRLFLAPAPRSGQ